MNAQRRLPPTTPLPLAGMTLEEARRLVSAWHFAKEALTPPEREMLVVAEGLLRLIDAVADVGVEGVQELGV